MPSPFAYAGIARSILMYYAIPFRAGQMRRLYAQFIRPGDLCFDIGAHVGSRLRTMTRLGARVVAVEPQAMFMRLLRAWYGRDPNVTLVEAAVASRQGEGRLLISQRTPTVSTLSADWAESVSRARSFSGVRWDAAAVVRTITLDDLIADYGSPAFCKLDIEGGELDALRGLSRLIPALSLEYIPATIDIALACIEHLGALGDYEFNRSIGETLRLAEDRWLDGPAMSGTLAALPASARSGDLYARLRRSDRPPSP